MRRQEVVIGLLILAGGVCLGAARGQIGKGEQPPSDSPTTSVQDALLKPFDLPFDQDTPLDKVAEHLAAKLHCPVVLDRAALDRLNLNADAPVRLQLRGVRLKTGLQLLLDQVGMTYRVVPEDNLLILTDNHGADDPLSRIQADLAGLHDDVHDLQDAIEDLARMFRDPPGAIDGPPVKNPTIIEEAPAAPGDKPEPGHTRPG